MTTERDAELSALLDGALAAPEAAALRSELERDPALAARLAELAQVDAALRALPARPVPADLRARLHAKLAAEATVRPQPGAKRAGATGLPRRRRAWLAGASAAIAAAAAALVVLLAGGPSGRRIGESTATTELAVEPAQSTLPSPELGAVAPGSAQRAAEEPPALAQDPPPAASATGSPDPSRIARSVAPSVERPVAEESRPSEAAPDGTAPSALAVAPAAGALPAPSAIEPSEAPAAAAAPQLAATETPAVEILVEVTDEEADALGALEPNDAGIVAVLDFLDELGALEAEAS